MSLYQYTVNTYKITNSDKIIPIQITDKIEAEDAEDMIQRLLEKKIIYNFGYEFLEVKII